MVHTKEREEGGDNEGEKIFTYINTHTHTHIHIKHKLKFLGLSCPRLKRCLKKKKKTTFRLC